MAPVVTTTDERASLNRAAKEVGRLISAFRATKKLTQEALAEALKVDQSTVSKWERGERIARDYQRRQIEKALGDKHGVIFAPLGRP